MTVLGDGLIVVCLGDDLYVDLPFLSRIEFFALYGLILSKDVDVSLFDFNTLMHVVNVGPDP